jgi:hypothetical protein
MLDAEQVEAFHRDGYLAPVAVLDGAEIASARANVDALMRRTRGLADPGARHKPHLYAKWVADLVRNPRVLDAIERILGPDLLVWRSIFFVKAAGDPGYVAWHQDFAYWGLDSDAVVTAWIALTESTERNGCLRVVPGSHRRAAVPHPLRKERNNLLARGQSAEVDEREARNVELAPGEMSVHHVRTLHGSGPNASDAPRIGLAVRYIATRVRQRGGRRSATLVRGADTFGHFDLEPEPRFDDDPAALAWHRRSRRLYAAELLRSSLGAENGWRSVARFLMQPGRVARAVRSLWRSPGGES